MTGDASARRRPIDIAADAAGWLARASANAVTTALGGREPRRNRHFPCGRARLISTRRRGCRSRGLV